MEEEIEEESEVFAERLELKPKQRVTQLIETANLRPEFDKFYNFEINSENLRIFKTMIDQIYLHTTLTKDERLNELFKILSIHPDFKKYFKFVMEKKEDKKKEKKVERIYNLTETDHIELEGRLIEILSYFIPRTELLIGILKDACDKQHNFMFSRIPSKKKKLTPTFGEQEISGTKQSRIYKKWKQGIPTRIICEEEAVQMNTVWAYISAEGKRVGDPKWVKQHAQEEDIRS